MPSASMLSGRSAPHPRRFASATSRPIAAQACRASASHWSSTSRIAWTLQDVGDLGWPNRHLSSDRIRGRIEYLDERHRLHRCARVRLAPQAADEPRRTPAARADLPRRTGEGARGAAQVRGQGGSARQVQRDVDLVLAEGGQRARRRPRRAAPDSARGYEPADAALVAGAPLVRRGARGLGGSGLAATAVLGHAHAHVAVAVAVHVNVYVNVNVDVSVDGDGDVNVAVNGLDAMPSRLRASARAQS